MTQETRPSAVSHTISIVMAALGGLIVLMLIATTAVTSLFVTYEGSSTMGEQTALMATDGIRELYVDAAAAEMTIEFGAVAEATLDVHGREEANWRLERYGDTLEVAHERSFLDPFVCLFGCAKPSTELTLTLPSELNGTLDAEVILGAGDLTVNGSFVELEIDVSAGNAWVKGEARRIDATLGAGNIDFDVEGVIEASLDIAAGTAQGQFTGEAPREIEIEVSAGSLDLALPDARYATMSDVAAGNVSNLLHEDSASKNRIEIDVAIGSVTLKPLNQ